MLKQRFLQKKVFISMTAIFFISIFILSCSKSDDEEFIEITASNHNPEVVAPGQALNFWGKWIEEQSKGKVKVTVHHNAALLKANEVYSGVREGIADAGYYALDSREGFILNLIIELPFMGWPTQVATVNIYEELMEKFPEIRSEWEGVKLIGFMMMPGTHIHTVDKQIITPDDLKGIKIHASEAMLANAISSVGATPVTINVEDLYMSLERGLVNGVINHFNMIKAFGALDLPKYHSIFGDGGINMIPMALIMNIDKYNSLPPEVQQIIENSRQPWADKFAELDKATQIATINSVKEMNHKITYLTADQIKTWHDAVKETILDKWINDAENKGLPGKAVYEETLRLINKYQGQ